MECLYTINVTTYNLFTLAGKILQWKILVDTNSNVCLHSILTFPLSFLSWIYWIHLPLYHSFEIIVIQVNMTSTRSNLMVNSQLSHLTSQEVLHKWSLTVLKSLFKNITSVPPFSSGSPYTTQAALPYCLLLGSLFFSTIKSYNVPRFFPQLSFLLNL